MAETCSINTLDELSNLAATVHERALAADRTDAFVCALNGDLGSGKTTFTQLLAKQFGVTETVTSPTFVIMKQYAIDDGPYRHFVHIDAYRIESVDELRVLGFAELLAQTDTIICIEWADQVREALPPERLTIDIVLTADTRTATFDHATDR